MECLQERRLRWYGLLEKDQGFFHEKEDYNEFDHLEKMEKVSCFIQCWN